MEVGIRELKARLSTYVSQAGEGATVLITDRGRPVARLVPLEVTSNLDRGIHEGWIEAARRTRLTPAAPVPAADSIASVLDDDRG